MDTQTLAAKKNEILSELHKDVFLTPKGMLKLVQLFVVICAFAMTTSASGTSYLRIDAGADGAGLPLYNVVAKIHTKYPFKKYFFQQSVFSAVNTTIVNLTKSDLVWKDGFESESKFYVFVGVITFLYVLAAIVMYGWFKKFSKMSDTFAAHFSKVDLVVTAALTFFWFLSITLWSSGFSALRSDTGLPHEFTTLVNQIADDSKADKSTLCPAPQFPCVSTDSWSKLYGSIIFGYLCVLLFGVNCWYCFKDTEWHAEPAKLTSGILQLRTEQGGPTAGLDDVNLEAGGTNDTATIQPGAI